MTIAPEQPATFGSGGAEPYARALRHEGLLQLVRAAGGAGRPASPPEVGDDEAFDVARWSADADAADLTTLDGETGPVLDIGCGPARMVRAAVDRGLTVLGLDVSPTAVAMAREAGLPVAGGSVFDPLPREGQWNLALLLDGNVGIGGDPTALLTRCAEILTATGSVVVETAPEASLDDSYEAHVVDDQGHASATFPWAEVGREALHRHARRAGLRVAQTWSVDGRTFCRLRAR
ncbi:MULTISPECIES: bifunctional 2-polyprenyl-6-hydroxyphenol methylase/3-demethylubiquinol 3-O-methyltransferase UbiG [unclassified Frigoribacterium]|uniref:class I SAM-dependent methyltransferase n=1 Tax=unclassified Frigoribacterium TaxID=2627005 RepID=UPI000F48F686|nr:MULTISPECIES: methyltransferase domain-containing protein [unclassified Frigoribacterium]NQW88270.1 methyltransferase domain-containing protein [Frigoribacterium sp. VKM Ac-2860]NQX08921.1 methyltransferase domain-containing protein [Frigoribacterium sp. VKM Ac-2859]ROS51031.1 methyltransferase family protein [Frigoribacterium sp. PhB118]